MKILITGGAGFIGSNLVEHFILQEHEVICLDNFSTGKLENIQPFLDNSKFKLIEGDIRNLETCNQATKGVDFIRNKHRLEKKHTQINGEIALCQTANQQYNCIGDFVDSKYFLSERLIKTIMATESGDLKFNPTINTEIAKTLLASMHKMHRASMDNYVTVDGKLRRLTPRECLRLMGFPDTFKQVVSDIQMYKQSGNSIVVDVLMAIMEEIINTGVFSK